jgi:hypothetical protein
MTTKKTTTKNETKKTTTKTTSKKTTKKNETYFCNANETLQQIENENDESKRAKIYARFLQSSIVIANRTITIEKYRDELLQTIRKNVQNSKMCKSIRHELRTRCLHRGALRNKKYHCIIKRTTIFAQR